MQIGVIFPQTEIGTDPIAIRDYAQAAEALGYSHLQTYDHVIGANPASRPGWSGDYNYTHMFHEPLVLFGYLAAATTKLELVLGILIVSQRQTALVAKQAAEVDVLSGGRLRLGVGTGWNDIEYEALGQDFHNRGRRSEEQIEVMRALWTNELVTYEGRWHKITDAGLNPLPVQRPIPVWLGGFLDRALERTVRLGDGWLGTDYPGEDARQIVEKLRYYAQQAGRDLASLGIDGGIMIADRSEEEWARDIEAWREMGTTHVSVNTMGAGLSTPTDHIDAITRFKDVAGS